MEKYENLVPLKKEAIDSVFEKNTINSIAELGSVWGVDCGYGLYALDKYKFSMLLEVDTHWTENAIQQCGQHKEVSTLTANFGSDQAFEFIKNNGGVDAIILFDVLLHQVNPDWTQILQMYSQHTEFFIIVEPIFTKTEHTVRLLDLGKDEYFKNVPHTPDHPTYKSLFEKMYEIHPEHNRLWRDVHHVWQWGITQNDLIAFADKLGFDLVHTKNTGQFHNLVNFDYISFVFKKRNKI